MLSLAPSPLGACRGRGAAVLPLLGAFSMTRNHSALQSISALIPPWCERAMGIAWLAEPVPTAMLSDQSSAGLPWKGIVPFPASSISRRLLKPSTRSRSKDGRKR